MIKVIYDVRFFANQRSRATGIPRYGIEFLKAINKIGGVHAMLVGDSASKTTNEQDRPVKIYPSGPFWQQWAIPLCSIASGGDLIHGLAGTLPVLAPINTVVTVHDIIFNKFPHLVEPRLARYLSRLVPMSISKAKVVIAVSEASASDILREGWCRGNKVRVVPLGVNRFWFDEEDSMPIVAYKYVISVGTLDPRKNVLYTLAVFEEMRKINGELHLVIVGNEGPDGRRIKDFISEHKLGRWVSLMGPVDDITLRRLYRHADALLFLSLYEGFGLPIVEAMASGCLPIVSDRGALPEVSGAGGVVVPIERPPKYVAGIITEMIRSDTNSNERRAGRKSIASRFSWERNATEVRDIYLDLV